MIESVLFFTVGHLLYSPSHQIGAVIFMLLGIVLFTGPIFHSFLHHFLPFPCCLFSLGCYSGALLIFGAVSRQMHVCFLWLCIGPAWCCQFLVSLFVTPNVFCVFKQLKILVSWRASNVDTTRGVGALPFTGPKTFLYRLFIWRSSVFHLFFLLLPLSLFSMSAIGNLYT